MSNLIVAHAAGFTKVEERPSPNRYLLTALGTGSRVYCQRSREEDSATIESESPVVMEIGRRRPAAPKGRLVSALLRLAHSVADGPLTRQWRSTSPSTLRRELIRAFDRLHRNRSNHPAVSMALMDQDHVVAATNGGGLLLKLGFEGVKEIKGDLGRDSRLRAVTSESSVQTDEEALHPGDRLILASPSLAATLTEADFGDWKLRCASPKRLADSLLHLARERGLNSASVITSSQATRVQPVYSNEVSVSAELAHAIQPRLEPATRALAAAG